MIRYTAIETEIVEHLRTNARDANDQRPEIAFSDGNGNPCRHCLKDIPKGKAMLVLAYRPFPSLQPYAETGPIFLCAEPCTRGGGAHVPDILTTSPDYLIKGYKTDHRILYGTGAIVPRTKIGAYAAQMLENPGVSYLHVRSARNNCYQLRIDRAE